MRNIVTAKTPAVEYRNVGDNFGFLKMNWVAMRITKFKRMKKTRLHVKCFYS